MKKLVLPIVLLLSVGSMDAMWLFRRKKVETPAATAATISAPEAAATAEPAKTAEAVTEETEEAKEFTLPVTEKFALGKGLLARQNETTLVNAITSGDIAKVKEILDTQEIDVTKPVKSMFFAGKTPIDIAKSSNTANKEEIVNLLLDAAKLKEAEEVTEEAPVATVAERILMWLPTAQEKPTGEEVEGVGALFEEPATEQVTTITPIKHYPTRFKQLEPRPLTVEFEGEKVERVQAPQVARPLPSKPAASKPFIFEELEESVVSKPAVAKQPARARVWPSTPAPQPVVETKKAPRALPTPPARVQEVKVEITPKARRPLPATPVSKPAAASSVIFEELETESAVAQPASKPAARMLPTPPTVKPAGRVLPTPPIAK